VHYRLFAYLLWIACPLLQAGILVALLRRRLSHNYRYFFAYTVLEVSSAIILAILAASSYTAYYYAYYANLALTVLVSFAVVGEILKTSFGRRRKALFPILCLAVLAIAALAVFLTTGMPDQPVTKLLMISDRVVRILQIGVLLLLAVFGAFLGAFRRTLVFGVGLGFGVFAVVNMLIAFALSSYRTLTSATLSTINSVAYLVACVIWLLYAIYGSSDANGFGRLPLLLSLTDDKGGLQSSTRWYSRIGFLQSRTAVGS
jgi:hypothetical protein